MSIFETVVMSLIGCLVGYMICMASWIKELCREKNDIQMEIAKLKAEMRTEDGKTD